jgi:hypothetical protein
MTKCSNSSNCQWLLALGAIAETGNFRHSQGFKRGNLTCLADVFTPYLHPIIESVKPWEWRGCQKQSVATVTNSGNQQPEPERRFGVIRRLAVRNQTVTTTSFRIGRHNCFPSQAPSTWSHYGQLWDSARTVERNRPSGTVDGKQDSKYFRP